MASGNNKFRILAGAFIFAEDKLLLIKKPGKDKFGCLRIEIMAGENILEKLAKAVKKEIGLKVKDINFFGLFDSIEEPVAADSELNHFLFLNYIIKITEKESIKLAEGGEYKWLSLTEWFREAEIVDSDILSELEKIEKVFLFENIENKYKRALADYQNLVKQTAKEKEDFYKFANEQFLYEILPIYDNLKIAVSHSGQNHNLWEEGIKHIFKQFSKFLSAQGVEEIKTVGQDFDHQWMEAVENELTDDKGKDGKVARELKSGYKLNGKVLMPAKVTVYKFNN